MVTTHFLNRIMGNVFLSDTSTQLPTSYHLGLSKTAPAVDGTGATEPTASDYKRIDITGYLAAPTEGTITNSATISFAESETPWGTATHYVVYDAATGGNLLMYGAFDESRTIETNTLFFIRTGELVFKLGNE